MDGKKKNDELHSRREFFKNAAKRVLPIIGAIALSNPIIQAAAPETPVNPTVSIGPAYKPNFLLPT